MAGSSGVEMAIAVATAGGLGSLPCAMLTPEEIARQVATFRERAPGCPINLNFFCHASPKIDPDKERAWKEHLQRFYVELGVDPHITLTAPARSPFDEALCAAVEATRPEVVSFHFGLPAPLLLERTRRTGAKIVSSATTVAEARYLEDHGCDAIIAQGHEAGGHRGTFLDAGASRGAAASAGIGTMALVPQVVDAVKVPVIAAGGIGDARGVVAAFALGAAAAQIGTAYLFTAESLVTPQHRSELYAAVDTSTTFTNVFTGRPARGIANRMIREVGPISELAPDFPRATNAVTPLRAKSEKSGSGDFSPLWAGQASSLSRRLGYGGEAPIGSKTTSAGELTRMLAKDALARFAR